MSTHRTRPASHADSWYKGDPTMLSDELEDNLNAVPSTLHDLELPIPGARVIIAPHAGYDYSGKCAAWAYRCLDLTKAKRVFVLGPSHTYYLRGCALTPCAKYETPFGDLEVDRVTLSAIREKGGADMYPDMPFRNDVKEHSLEMHLPYIYKRMQQTFPSEADFPVIVPMLVGDNNREGEKEVGKVLAEYLEDEENAFVVSSDFCHWGSRFDYTVYSPTAGAGEDLRSLSRANSKVSGEPIHETIKAVDQAAMDAIESGEHDRFYDNLKATKNTVCGRHPIGAMMAALEELGKKRGKQGEYKFRFVRYERSTLVEDPRDSSVSYGSAYAVV